MFQVHSTRSRAKAAREKQRSLSCAPSENATLLSTEGTNGRFQRTFILEFLDGMKEISIFVFHNILNYGLMLAVMIFNGYIFVSVALGAFVGYFMFGHLSMKTNMENLQAIQTKIICSTRCADSGKSRTPASMLFSLLSCGFSLQSQARHALIFLPVLAQTIFAITISKSMNPVDWQRNPKISTSYFIYINNIYPTYVLFFEIYTVYMNCLYALFIP